MKLMASSLRRLSLRSPSARTLLVAAGIALVLPVMAASSAATRADDDSVSGSGVASRAIEVDIIGDSLSTGAKTAGESWASVVQRTFDERGRDVLLVNASENGAGYVARGEYGDNFLDQVDQVVTARSQVVVVFGSDNDLGQSGVATAISTTLDRVRSRAPKADVIVVGPPAPPAQSATRLAAIRDELSDATDRVAATFVDPLSLMWFQGAARVYVGPDDEHPNLRGEQYLAAKMLGVLSPAIDSVHSA